MTAASEAFNCEASIHSGDEQKERRLKSTVSIGEKEEKKMHIKPKCIPDRFDARPQMDLWRSEILLGPACAHHALLQGTLQLCMLCGMEGKLGLSSDIPSLWEPHPVCTSLVGSRTSGWASAGFFLHLEVRPITTGS